MLLVALLLAIPAVATTPPALLNYQGVLRDSADNPLDGSFDMVFRFYDSADNELLLDKHTALEGGAVSVAQGLFSVQLGSGQLEDGSGPGYHPTLDTVFRDHQDVFLGIEIDGETLSPRVRVVAAAYAINTTYFDGRYPSDFLDTSQIPQTKSGPLSVSAPEPGTIGVQGTGTDAGGYFFDRDASGQAYVGYGDRGLEAVGDEMGGFFADADASGQAELGSGNYGLRAFGAQAGGYFEDSDNTGWAELGTGNYGVRGFGSFTGGYFKDYDNSGQAYVGFGERGIEASGDDAGAFFWDRNASGRALLATGNNGIEAEGTNTAGYFSLPSLDAYAYLARDEGAGLTSGVIGLGRWRGGWFADMDATQIGEAWLGFSNIGVHAEGNPAARFWGPDPNNDPAAILADLSGGFGIKAWGTVAGGWFMDMTTGGTTLVADWDAGTFYKVKGSGIVSFVQNHPHDKDRTIVYAAPEGDEVAVYTRGSGRLHNGFARVRLAETFPLVANPDIGLTAHITPRGSWAEVYVESVTTEELVVSGPAGSNAAFDYLIYGLRIGFERHAPLQPKEEEAFLPPPSGYDEFYAAHPDLSDSNAMGRFRAIQSDLGLNGNPDLSRAQALAAAINEGRETYLADLRTRRAAEVEAVMLPGSEQASRLSRKNESAAPAGIGRPAAIRDPVLEGAAPPHGLAENPVATGTATLAPASPNTGSWFPVSSPVVAGDLVRLDETMPGALELTVEAFDTSIAGCAIEPPEGTVAPPGQVLVAVAGPALCRVDAGFGPIAVGDLLTTSSNPGHAMRFGESARGAILGKAMEPLAYGTGSIRVLITLR